eukprot:7413202-Pyramimonas_sp.AAC.1
MEPAGPRAGARSVRRHLALLHARTTCWMFRSVAIKVDKELTRHIKQILAIWTTILRALSSKQQPRIAL